MASIVSDLAASTGVITPASVYGHTGEVKLRIATGGAGQTGVLQELAERFIDYCSSHSTIANRISPFQIAWLATDTSQSFNALASKAADIAITYHPYAEYMARCQGITIREEYLWRDAFNLVGPISNPAHLPVESDKSIFELFADIYQSAVASSTSDPVRFLSRFDKSANNILESRLWTSIGLTPWSSPSSIWYHTYVAFPRQALEAAAALGEYTLVDRGTWLCMRDLPHIKDRMMVYREGDIGWRESGLSPRNGHILAGDSLGNPAHGLLSPYALDPLLAELFLDWMMWQHGGQKVIHEFVVNKGQLHGQSPDIRVDDVVRSKNKAVIQILTVSS